MIIFGINFPFLQKCVIRTVHVKDYEIMSKFVKITQRNL